jgi:hypothetical protein
MVAAWGIAIPCGILIARFHKVRPGQDWPRELDNRFWWRWHRMLQYSAMACATAAMAIIWNHLTGNTQTKHLHAVLGWIVMITGWLQILGASLRGSKGGPTDEFAVAGSLNGDHYDMTFRRRCFEYLHKAGGYAAAAGSVMTILLGLNITRAPHWMWITLLLWWVILVIYFVRLQRLGRCVDTYQAIWGPDPRLPGNRQRPIGWGVRRPCTAASHDAHSRTSK